MTFHKVNDNFLIILIRFLLNISRLAAKLRLVTKVVVFPYYCERESDSEVDVYRQLGLHKREVVPVQVGV